MPTDYVLIHGSGEANWIWDQVREALNRHRSGFAIVHGSHSRSLDTVNHVVAEDLPGHGYRFQEDLSSITLLDYVETVAGWIEDHHLHNVVLVGHDIAGFVMPLVARRLPSRIRSLVFLGCIVPPTEQEAQRFMNNITSFKIPVANIRKTAAGGLPLPHLLPFLLRSLLQMSDKRGVKPLPKSLAQLLLCNGLDPALAGSVISRLTPYPFQPLVTPVFSDSPTHISTTYVVFTRDRILPASLQHNILRGPQHTKVIEIEGGHTSALYTHVSEIVDILLNCA